MDISAEIAAIQAASQGSELRQPLVGALNKLNSGSLPAVTASDAGKILKVGANGWEVGEKSGYMPVPTATKQITENGTHDVTDYASAVVNVSGGGSSTLISKTITQNGTYDPANDNADGYSEVTVNVSGGTNHPGNPFVYYKDYIRATGTQYIDTGYKLPADQTNVIIMMVCKYNMSGAADAVLFGVERCLLAYKGNNGQNYYAYTWKATGQTGTIYQASSNGRNIKATVICNKEGYSVFATPLSQAQVQTGNNFSNAETQENIYLFASNEGNAPRLSSMGQFDLYNFKVITAEGVALDLVPAKDDNDIVCMKDNVSGNYLYNAGTGDFVWGTDQ